MRPSDSVCGVDRRAYSDVVFAAVTSSSSSSSICGCSDAVARRAASEYAARESECRDEQPSGA